MRLRTENGRVAGLNRKLAQSLERLRIEMGIDLVLWSDILGTSQRDYAESLQDSKDISLRAVEALANHLDVSLELLVDGPIDYRALVARMDGDLARLPERYSVGAFSSNRTVINLLAYLEQTCGWRTVKSLLRRMQVHEAAFQDPNGMLSIQFQGDLCDLLAARGFTSSDLRRFGAYSAVTNRNTPIGRILSGARDSSELYVRMIEEASSLYDRNFDYSVLDSDWEGCTIEAVPSELVQDTLKTKTPGSLGACTTRAGVFQSAPTYIQGRYSHVDEVRCVHRGDPVCEYQVRYS